MSQFTRDRHGAAVLNGCIGTRMFFLRRSCPPHFTHTVTRTGNFRYTSPRLPQSRHSQVDSSLDDGSWPLFNMYLSTAKEEDTAMAEGWKADAEGILLFVSAYFTVRVFEVNSGIRVVDWSVLCHRRILALRVHADPPARLAGEPGFSSCKCLSERERAPWPHPCRTIRYIFSVLSTEIRRRD